MSEEPPAQEPSPPPAPEPAPEPAVEPAPAPEPGVEPAESAALPPLPDHPPVKPRRRGRTTALIAAAAVLGVLAGGGLGYRIQQNRPPTALPPLTGPMPVQPQGSAPPTAALPVAQDRNAVYEGDLLKLLIPTPKTGSAHELAREWLSLEDYAETFKEPDGAFDYFASNQFQRAVTARWLDVHHTYVKVNLVQFRDEVTLVTAQELLDETQYVVDDPQYADAVHIPGTVEGQVWGSARPDREEGYEPEYAGRGLARMGNIYVEVFVNSPHPIAAKTVMSLTKQQLERL